MGALRAQSAMEYLMTYGWAILVVAVVLAVLFELGIFGGTTTTTCIAQPGFTCTDLIFDSNVITNAAGQPNPVSEPSISARIGTTYGPWTDVYLVVVPYGQVITDTNPNDYTNSADFYYWSEYFGQYCYTQTLQSGQVITAMMYMQPDYPHSQIVQLKLGTQFNGEIWAMYTPAAGPQYEANQVIEVATFKAVATSH